MKRVTFMGFPHTSDCCEEVECVVERERIPVGTIGNRHIPRQEPVYHYRLVSYPSQCKCGYPIHIAEPSQAELKDAWNLPEAEDA